MRLIAVSMIRNEADILPDFLGHCAALFDEVLVVDHMSSDGTAEMLDAAARRMPLAVWRFPWRAKAMAAIVTALAQEAARRGATRIFPLDADEFPHLNGRAALEARLADAPPLLAWRWRNVWPASPGGFAAFRLAGRHETAASRTLKVSIAAGMTRSARFAVGHGNHVARPRDPHRPVPEGLGELLHLPLRSAERLGLKVAMNLAALGDAAQDERHAQYQRAANRMDDLLAPGGEALRRRFALFYPHMAPPPGAPAATETHDLAPLGRMEGLPAPVGTLAEVMAREQAIRWRTPPPGPPASWRVRLKEGLAVPVTAA